LILQVTTRQYSKYTSYFRFQKRRRRNIAKVAGLGIVPYDEATDTFTGREMYDPDQDNYLKRAVRTQNDTRLNISTLRKLQEGGIGGKRSSATRPTRIPENPGEGFPDDSDEDEDQIESNYDFNDEALSKTADHGRPYFLNQLTMGRLQMLLTLGQASGAFPWTWNKEKHMIDKWTPAKERWWYWFWSITTFQTVLLSGFQIYAFFYRLEAGNYRQLFMWSFSFVWYSCAVVFNLNMYIFKDYIRQYINTLLFMNKKFMGKKLGVIWDS